MPFTFAATLLIAILRTPLLLILVMPLGLLLLWGLLQLLLEQLCVVLKHLELDLVGLVLGMGGLHLLELGLESSHLLLGIL